MAGIYLHIPFCRQACYYCDFHFSTNLARRERIVHTICQELGLQKDYLNGEEIETIYFGGGTPSILSEGELNYILEAIRTNFAICSNPEVTLEANPDDLTQDKLKQLRNAGVNRLSIGIQSFSDEILKALNRVHDSQMAVQCVHDAFNSGFDNISIDLIYAIPGLENTKWKDAIDEALMLKPQHISSYSLTVEEKTVFGRWAARGKFKAVEEDIAALQLQILVETLEMQGYEQYEVSNFSKTGYQSKHNSNYWKNKIYLGVGPSAHSYNGKSRQYNISNNSLYTESIQNEQIPATLEILTREDKANEYLLTSLRTAWGINLSLLRKDFGLDLQDTHEQYLRILKEQKLAIIVNDTLVLTKKGFLVADKIASDFFVVSS
jgi:oxygen-independent coproporphyrinogen-3 oxidase